jgi:hypothetical protein
MVAVTAGEVEPINVGIVLLRLDPGLSGVFELGRAQEWTAALTAGATRSPTRSRSAAGV